VVRARAPAVVICLDAFHVVAGLPRRLMRSAAGVWNQLRRAGDTSAASAMKNTRWALLKNPPDLTGNQRKTWPESLTWAAYQCDGDLEFRQRVSPNW